MSGGPRWRATLEGEAARRARASARAIADALLATEAPPSASLAEGSAGHALLFDALHRTTGHAPDGDAAIELLDQSLRLALSAPTPPSLFSGVAGVAWTAQRITDDPELGPFLEGVDALLLRLLDDEGSLGSFDLINGLVGFGVYFLDRLPADAGRAGLRAVVQALAGRAVWQDGACRWLSLPRHPGQSLAQAFPRGWYDLGLAHGAPGVVSFLCACDEAIVGDEAGRLVDGAVAWMLRQRQPPGAGSAFPDAVGHETASPPYRSRVAWCYGDASMALSLLRAGARRGQRDWCGLAAALAAEARRRPPEETGVRDGALCHGSAGLVQLWGRFFQITGEEAFRSAAVAWAEATMARLGQAPLDAFLYPKFNARTADTSFLTGAAGAALALLSAAADEDPSWDRVLLLS